MCCGSWAGLDLVECCACAMNAILKQIFAAAGVELELVRDAHGVARVSTMNRPLLDQQLSASDDIKPDSITNRPRDLVPRLLSRTKSGAEVFCCLW